jgi:hypothetical protein
VLNVRKLGALDGEPGLCLKQAWIIGAFSSGKESSKVIGLLLDLAWLYIRVAIETVWQDRRVRFLFWLLAVGIAIWRAALGHLSLDDVINDIVIGIIISVPFLR